VKSLENIGVVVAVAVVVVDIVVVVVDIVDDVVACHSTGAKRTKEESRSHHQGPICVP